MDVKTSLLDRAAGYRAQAAKVKTQADAEVAALLKQANRLETLAGRITPQLESLINELFGLGVI